MAYKFQLGAFTASGSITAEGELNGENISGSGNISGSTIALNDASGIAGGSLENDSGVLKVSDGGIDTLQLAANAVETAKILNAAVTTDKILNAAVTTAKLAADAVDGTKLADDAVASEHIADGAVLSASIAAGVVETGHISASAVTTAKLADASVTNAKIADNAINSPKILNASVTTEKLGADAVDGTKLADDAVDSEHIADGAVLSASIAAGAVVTGHISASAVTEAKLANGAVSTAKLAADAVDGTKLADDAVASEHIADGAVLSASIAAGAVVRGHLAADAVDGTKLADDAVDSEHIAAGAVDTEHIADGNVTNAKLANASFSFAGEVVALGGTGSLDALSAGNGLTGSAYDGDGASSFAVKADGGTLTVAAGGVKVSDLGIDTAQLAAAAVTNAKLNADVAGNGISGGNGSALSVNLSGTSLTVDGDGLRLSPTIPDAHTFSSDITIAGNLTVQGNQTSLNTTELFVDDVNITIGSGSAPADNMGITFGTSGSVETLQIGNSVAELQSSLPLSASTYYGDGSNLTNVTPQESIQTLSANGTIDLANGVQVIASASSDLQLTLPAVADAQGKMIKVKARVGAYKVTLVAPSGSTIDGFAQVELESENAAVSLMASGSEFFII
jgi:hypothetical protein